MVYPYLVVTNDTSERRHLRKFVPLSFRLRYVRSCCRAARRAANFQFLQYAGGSHFQPRLRQNVQSKSSAGEVRAAYHPNRPGGRGR